MSEPSVTYFSVTDNNVKVFYMCGWLIHVRRMVDSEVPTVPCKNYKVQSVNFIPPIGGTCRPCGTKNPLRRHMSNLNTGVPCGHPQIILTLCARISTITDMPATQHILCRTCICDRLRHPLCGTSTIFIFSVRLLIKWVSNVRPFTKSSFVFSWNLAWT